MLKIVALISGGGTILRSLLEACDHEDYPAQVVAVGADNEASGLDHARERGIPTFVVEPKKFQSRELWAQELLKLIRSYGVAQEIGDGLVLSAGLMRILPESFVAQTAPYLINTHPSLLPKFPGANAVRDAIDSGDKETGVTVHIIDAGVDTGPIIRQARVVIDGGESVDELHEKIKKTERPLLIEVVRDIATKKIDLSSFSLQENQTNSR